jgi:hypothetical protein
LGGVDGHPWEWGGGTKPQFSSSRLFFNKFFKLGSIMGISGISFFRILCWMNPETKKAQYAKKKEKY